MQRVTLKDLGHLVTILNRLTNSPDKPGAMIDGKYITYAGHYQLGGAYGGWKLERMMDAGGVESITGGYVPKRELYDRISAYIDGVRAGMTR